MKDMHKNLLFIGILTSAATALTSSESLYDTVQSNLEQFKNTILYQLPSSYEEVKNKLLGRQSEVSAQELYDNIKKISSARNWDELNSTLGELKDKGVILSSNAINALSEGLKNLQKTGTDLSLTAMENVKELISDWSGQSKEWLENLNEQPATMREIEDEFILLGQEDEDFVLLDDDDDFVHIN